MDLNRMKSDRLYVDTIHTYCHGVPQKSEIVVINRNI